MAYTNDRNAPKLDYIEEEKKLKIEGPKRLYLLYGKEDYLRDQFLRTLKSICFAGGDDSFSYTRLNGPGLDLDDLTRAVNSVPFMTERTLVELHDVDINKIKDAKNFISLLSDIPEYCTVVFLQTDSEYKFDGRISFVKSLREIAYEMNFVQQAKGKLFNWIARRFSALGKKIEFDTIQRLITVSGDLMGNLIPEIEKIGAYAKGEYVTIEDVNSIAIHVPDAEAFELLDHISKKEFNITAGVLSEILTRDNQDPIYVLAVIGNQMRKIYVAKLAQEKNLGLKYLMDTCAIRYDFQAKNIMNAARGYTMPQIKNAVELCAITDYRMKSSGIDSKELLKELIFRIATESGINYR